MRLIPNLSLSLSILLLPLLVAAQAGSTIPSIGKSQKLETQTIQQKIEAAYRSCGAPQPTSGVRNFSKGPIRTLETEWAPADEIDQLLQHGWQLSFRAQYEPAIACLEEVLALYRAIGDLEGQGKTLFNIAWVHYSTADYQRSIDHYKQALTIQRTIQDRENWGETHSLGGLGLVYHMLGDQHTAIAYAEEALQLAVEDGDRKIEGYSLVDLGDYSSPK